MKSTATATDEAALPDDVRVIFEVSDGEGHTDLPFEVTDDFRLHLVTGVRALRGTYVGRARVVKLFETLNESVEGGNVSFEIKHLSPLAPTMADGFLVMVCELSVKTRLGDRSWDVCTVGLREGNRVREAWAISSSIADGRVEEFIQVATSISRPFSLECSRCHSVIDVSFGRLMRLLLPPTLWMPMRGTYPIFRRCPRCDRLSWLSFEIPALGSAIDILVRDR